MNDFWQILQILLSSSGSSSSSEEDNESAFFVVDWSPLVLSCPPSMATSVVVVPLKVSSVDTSSLVSGCSTMDDGVSPFKLFSFEKSRLDSICSIMGEGGSTLICD